MPASSSAELRYTTTNADAAPARPLAHPPRCPFRSACDTPASPERHLGRARTAHTQQLVSYVVCREKPPGREQPRAARPAPPAAAASRVVAPNQGAAPPSGSAHGRIEKTVSLGP